jgi:hypothetical protein
MSLAECLRRVGYLGCSVVLAGSLLGAQPADAATYYVATTGNNNNPGTIAAPFQTLAKALGVMGPGDTVFMRGGTYLTGQANIPSGSSWAAPVTIRNYPGEIVNIGDGASTGQRFSSVAYAQKFVIIEGDYVPTRTPKRGIVFNKAGIDMRGEQQKFRNIEVKNGTGTAAISVGSYSELINMDVHHNGGSTSTLNHGIYSHSSHLLIDGGEWHENVAGYAFHLQNSKASQGGGCVDGEEDTPSNPNGCGSIDITVRNVKCWGNGHCLLTRRGRDAKIYNNMVYRNGSRGLWVESSGSVVYNNTVWGNNTVNGNATAGNCQVGTSSGVTIVNNLVWGSAKGRPAFCENGVSAAPNRPGFHHNLFGNTIDPLVVNTTANDFRLTANSPARDAGVNLAGFSKDFFGANRPVGSTTDIGAHEFGGTTSCPTGDCTPPSVPGNVSLTRTLATPIDGD